MAASRPVIKQLDHVIARVGDPRALFSLLTETMGLPVAWPLKSYPAFQSGGVALGNLYLEIMQCGARRKNGTHASGRLCAIAFESPQIDAAAEELSRRGLAHTPVAPYFEKAEDGTRKKIWSNVVLGKLVGSDLLLDATIFLSHLPGAVRLSDAGAGGALNRWQIGKLFERNLVFLVDYAYGNFGERPHWSEFESHDEKRAADLAQFRSRGGGAIGLESVKEVVAGVEDFDATQKLWRSLYAPAVEIAEGVWEIADGPAVRLVASDANAIQTLVLKVTSLERAETFLREGGMLGEVTDEQIKVAPEKIEGLDVRLVE